MNYAFPPPIAPSLPIANSETRFPVHRIYCIGRNYADHAKEMGAAVSREQPMFFCKPADAVVAPGEPLPFPRATADLHHELELVVALGRDADGPISTSDALKWVFAYAVGLDLTRRDLQAAAKARSWPWDTAKAFDHSAPISALQPCSPQTLPQQGRLWLEVNGQMRQQADLSQMLFPVAQIIAELSELFDLRAGDLIFTGTPAGVAALQPGDHLRAGLDEQELLTVTMGLPRPR